MADVVPQSAQGPLAGSEEVTGPDVLTLADLVRAAADRYGERVAWTFVRPASGASPESWSFTAIRTAVEALAGWLRTVSQDGARVALMLPNVPSFPLCWLATAWAGRVSVPVNSTAQVDDTAHVLRDSGATLVITTPDRRALVQAAAGLVQQPVTVATTDEIPGLHPSGPEPGYAHARAGASAVEPLTHRVVNIQYTSGTTGMPKGCMLSHTYWLEIARSLRDGFPGVGPDDVLYTAQPFSYIDPQWNVTTALLAGARLVIDERFSASRMWATLRAEQVTLFYCVGIMPAALLAQDPRPDDRDHHVRAVMASAIPSSIHAELEQRWGVPWFEAFGMTETGADLAVTPQDHDDVVGTACVGRPHRRREVVVLSPDGRPLTPGHEGELAVRGVGMMDGYWRRPDETDEAFRGGWLHTGDKVVQDDRGRFYYLGRYKEMIRRSGENISAREVETVIESHPAVRLAAAVATPDQLRGEEVKAFVVLRSPADPSQLRSYCGERLAPFKVPRFWAVRDSLPMTPSERIARGLLAQDDGPVWDSQEDPG